MLLKNPICHECDRRVISVNEDQICRECWKASNDGETYGWLSDGDILADEEHRERLRDERADHAQRQHQLEILESAIPGW